MKITPLTYNHHTAWAQLLATCFNRTAQDMQALLDWLHQIGQLVAWGAWDGDTLVAQYTCLLRDLCHKQMTLSAGMSINMAVHPDYRGQGLVKQVSAPVYDHVQSQGALIGMGFSNAEGVQVDKNSKSYGYQVLGKLESHISLLPATHYGYVDLNNHFPDNLCFPCIKQNADRIRFIKTVASFRLRYDAHPFRNYRYGFWYDNQQIQGVVVYREIQRFGVKGVALLDACGIDLAELIRKWGSTMHKNGYRFVHTMVTPSADLKTVLQTLYTTLQVPYIRTPYYLTIKPLTNNLPDSMESFTQWDFIGGDIL